MAFLASYHHDTYISQPPLKPRHTTLGIIFIPWDQQHRQEAHQLQPFRWYQQLDNRWQREELYNKRESETYYIVEGGRKSGAPFNPEIGFHINPGCRATKVGGFWRDTAIQ